MTNTPNKQHLPQQWQSAWNNKNMSELILYQTEDGGAEVRYRAKLYRLEMILAIGYRVHLLANTINPILLTRRCHYG